MIYSIIFALPADASVIVDTVTVDKPTDAPNICPGTAVSWPRPSAKAEAKWVLNNSCDEVRQEIYARVAKENNWIDAHNQGTYANRTATDESDESLIELTRTTPYVMLTRRENQNVQFTDKLNLKLEPNSSNTQCTVYGCSESQVTSFFDFSTNFCNLQVLVGGTDRSGGNQDYRFVHHDLETVTDSRKIFSTTSNHKGDGWLETSVPVQPDSCISYPVEPIAQCDSETTGNCNCGTVYCHEREHTCSTHEDGEQRCEGKPDYARLASKYDEWKKWLQENPQETSEEETPSSGWLWR